jgi:hypothetical protein
VLRWAGRYRLSEHGREITSSNSYFKVPTTSVVRVFFDTLKTGVLVRYKVLDHTGKEVISSKMQKFNEEGFTEQGQDFAIVHQP